MSITPRIRSYLTESCIEYEVMKHPHSLYSRETARLSNLPAARLAKSVLVKHVDGYALSVVPADRYVNLAALQDILHYRLRLAREDEIKPIFPDCETGAIPPLGFLYGLKTVVDFEFENAPRVFFEAGDHETVVVVSDSEFAHMMHDIEHADVSCASMH